MRVVYSLPKVVSYAPTCTWLWVWVCANSKLTAAVKFLSEHHRGEADGSWQGAGAQGGGRGRWRWATGEGRGCPGAHLMIEGSVQLRGKACRGIRNPLLLLSWSCWMQHVKLLFRSLEKDHWFLWIVFSKCIYRWCSLTFRHRWNHSQLAPLHFKWSGNSTGPTVWGGWSGLGERTLPQRQLRQLEFLLEMRNKWIKLFPMEM